MKISSQSTGLSRIFVYKSSPLSILLIVIQNKSELYNEDNSISFTKQEKKK